MDPAPVYPGLTTNESLHVIPENTRDFFYWLILAISVVAVLGNVLAIKSVIYRNTKVLQKSCIITLAVTDIFTVVLFAINNLTRLSNELMIWTLGERMCYFIPMGQVLGTTASSFSLLIISLDRYQNVIYALSNRWKPRPATCVFLMFLLLMICTVLSYPMATTFNYELLTIVFVGPYSQRPIYQYAHTCVASKNRLTIYYIAVSALIFLPILSIFFLFYVKIAMLIWKHRKPLKPNFNKFDAEDPSSNTTKSTILTPNMSRSPKPPVNKKRNLHAERKIRTFRIVLVLMVSFAFCRLPYWSYYIIRLVGNIKGDASWNVNFALVALNLLNCALNPLLYTFLNETISAIKIMNDFMCKVCCCCFSNDEFEDFEKHNPFPRERHDNPDKTYNNKTVKFGKVTFYEKHNGMLPKY